MTFSTLALGRRGEAVAVDFLRQNGFHIVDTNYRCPVGEIDIVAEEKNALVFVEVKARRSMAMGGPLEAVTVRKQRKIIQVARWYLRERQPRCPGIRFDVIGILFDGDEPIVELCRNAFQVAS